MDRRNCRGDQPNELLEPKTRADLGDVVGVERTGLCGQSRRQILRYGYQRIVLSPL